MVVETAVAIAVDESLALLQRKPGLGENAVECWVSVTAFARAAKKSTHHFKRKAISEPYFRTPLYQFAMGG